MTSEDVERLVRWYNERVRPFLAEHLQDKVAGLDEAIARIRTLDRNVTDELAICFLGASGVGKSTLINALVAGQELFRPAASDRSLRLQWKCDTGKCRRLRLSTTQQEIFGRASCFP